MRRPENRPSPGDTDLTLEHKAWREALRKLVDEIAQRRVAREDVWGVSLRGGKFTMPEDRS